MARRIYRAPNGDEVEVVGRGPTWNMLNAGRGQRHRGPAGGPELAGRGYFRVRYRIDGKDYFQTEFHPRGLGGGRRAKGLLKGFVPPAPGEKDTGRPVKKGERE